MLTLLRRLFSVGSDATPEENFFISSGLEFYGDLVARASSGRIEGKFDGHIIECRKLIIGPHATIKGNVFAEEIVVYGYCEGNLYAAGDMKVFDTAVILGDIHASSLIVEHNATFRGNLRKLRTEDFLEITAREKEKIIQQRKSNVYNIHSLNARLEAEQRRARKVANGIPLTPETEERPNMPLKRIQTAAPIIVPQNRITPSPVTTGSEMPRAINVPLTPVDVSTLSGGASDFMVPAMDESFLPDYVVPMPNAENEPAEQKKEEILPLTEATANELTSEPSASMMLLETAATEEEAQTVETISEEIVEAEAVNTAPAEILEEMSETAADTLETEEPAAEIIAEVEILDETITIEESVADVEEELLSFMEADEAEALITAQLEADELWMQSAEAEVEETEVVADLTEDLSTEAVTPDETQAPEEIMLETAADAADVVEEKAEVSMEAGSYFSFPTTVSTSFDPFPVMPNDNGIRIDPSIPFIRIPDAAPQLEDVSREEMSPAAEVRASFSEEIGEEARNEHIEMTIPAASVEISRKPLAKVMIPRQLSSPEAYEIREASGTMIIIREEQDDAVSEAIAAIDHKQVVADQDEAGEFDGEEPKYKIPAVPTAEPGYEPGYTNQQRTTRKPVTVQPENTRRWF